MKLRSIVYQAFAMKAYHKKVSSVKHVHTPEKVTSMEEAFEGRPNCSVHRHAMSLDISDRIVQRDQRNSMLFLNTYL